MMNALITGWGMYAPTRIMTNQDLEKLVDTSDEWIRSRTGIRERRVAADDDARELARGQLDHVGGDARHAAGDRLPLDVDDDALAVLQARLEQLGEGLAGGPGRGGPQQRQQHGGRRGLAGGERSDAVHVGSFR